MTKDFFKKDVTVFPSGREADMSGYKKPARFAAIKRVAGKAAVVIALGASLASCFVSKEQVAALENSVPDARKTELKVEIDRKILHDVDSLYTVYSSEVKKDYPSRDKHDMQRAIGDATREAQIQASPGGYARNSKNWTGEDWVRFHHADARRDMAITTRANKYGPNQYDIQFRNKLEKEMQGTAQKTIVTAKTIQKGADR